MDLTGQKFNLWTVISLFEKGQSESLDKYECKCECETIAYVRYHDLVNNKSKRCSKCRYIKNDLSGQQFGSWKVLAFDEKRNGTYYWMCECKCGYIKSVASSNLAKKSSCRKCSSQGEDITGKIFGNWIVIKKSEEVNGEGKSLWITQCKCGKS